MPILGVNVAILHAGQVVLMKREDFEVWGLPGGQVDPGESLAQCACREAREETGLEVRLTRLVGAYSQPHWIGGGVHVVLFAAEPIEGKLRPQPGEALDVGFFFPDRLPEPLRW